MYVLYRKIARILHHISSNGFQIEEFKETLDVIFMINVTLLLIRDMEKGNVRLDWKI